MSKHLPQSLQTHRRRYCGSCGSANLWHRPCSDTGLGWTECLECDWTRNHVSTAHHCHDCGWAKPPGPVDHVRVIGSGLPRPIEAEPYLVDRRREVDASWAPTQPEGPLLEEKLQQGDPRASRLVVGIAVAGLAALLALC
ncbi:MAG: hypothetical protein EOP40_14510, partial [Rubrivivax sp.]